MKPFDMLQKYSKVLMLVTIVFLVFSVAVLLNNVFTTGSFMKRDIDLNGGKEITFEVTSADLAKITEVAPYASVRLTSGVTKNLLVEIPFEKNETEAINDIGKVVSYVGRPSVRSVGPSLGSLFFQQAQLAIFLAFVFMAITVFIIFRSPVPSSIVILAAATDIIGTMAVISIIGIPLSLPVLGALLALIGYSVDTDILLTSELLKSGRADFHESVRRAMKTGLTMTSTILIALLSMYFVSGSFVIEQIALVLLIGLLIDMPATWLTNAGVLQLWMERKQRRAAQ